jgi:hypothetical protein
MSIAVDPQTEAALRERARAHGQDLESYLRTIAEADASTAKAAPSDFRRALEAFSEGTEHLPPLGEEDLTREAMYRSPG